MSEYLRVKINRNPLLSYLFISDLEVFGQFATGDQDTVFRIFKIPQHCGRPHAEMRKISTEDIQQN